jgi:hypothetical protein
MERFKLIIKGLFAYIGIAGLVTFSLFICQEASQTAMFGTWPAKDTKQWSLVLTGADLMARINFVEKCINYSVGWIQPLAFLAYRSHTQAVDYYVKVTHAEVFVREPSLMIGRHVEFHFKPRSIKILDDGRRMAVNRNIGVFVDDNYKLGIMFVSGQATEWKEFIIIK